MNTSTRLDTTMAPWICGVTRERMRGGIGATWGRARPYLPHAGLPDVGGVERQHPVAVDLLWGWRREEVSAGMAGSMSCCHHVILVLPSGGHCHFSSARMALAGTRKASALAWNSGSLRGGRVGCSPWEACGPGAAVAALPDAHGGLDEGGDADAGEDGADEVADGQLVLAHTQALGQQEGHGDGAAKAGQVVLGGQRWGGSEGSRGRLWGCGGRAVPGSPTGCRDTRGARPRFGTACQTAAGPGEGQGLPQGPGEGTAEGEALSPPPAPGGSGTGMGAVLTLPAPGGR